MGPSERRFRSRLVQLAAGHGLLRGSILERQRVCGKPGCRCARGHKHRAVYLVVSEKGRPRQLYVPAAWEQRVRQWVANHQELRKLVREIGQVYWQKVKGREE